MLPTGWANLSFEDRQKQWKGELRQFRQHHGRADRPTVWEIRVDGNRIYTRHGLLGGAMQETNTLGKAKNVGKANAISQEQDAMAEARRDARKKWDFEGYDEYVGDQNIDHRHQDISVQALLTTLPGSFCLYKPENNLYDQKRLLEKAKKGEAIYTLKRDGVAKLIVLDYYGNIQIYSRRARAWQDKEGPRELPDGTLDYGTVVPWARRFPHLVEAVRQLGLPNGTMLACELVLPDRDDFPYVSGLTKGYTARALEDMAAKGYPSLYWWDIPFLGGEDLVKTAAVKERHAYIRSRWQSHSGYDSVRNWIQPISFGTFPNPEAAEEHAKAQKIEGYVVLDPDAIYGDKGWNLKGKPDRPSSIAKLKPTHEDDFVAYWDPDKGVGEWGEGRHEAGKTVTLPDGSTVVHGGVGSIALYQYNESGELVFTANCSGMEYAFQANLRKENFPFVCQVEYRGRTYVSDGEKTNALRHPAFLRVRDDKTPQECVNPRL